MNYLQLTAAGRLTKHAKYFAPNGDKKAMAAFTIAVNRGTGESATASFIEVELRGKAAESTNQYLTGGKTVLVTGNVEAVAFAKNDGTPGASLKLYAYDVVLGADAAAKSADPV